MNASDIQNNIENNRSLINNALSSGGIDAHKKLSEWFANQACMESQVLFRTINDYPSKTYTAISNHSNAMQYIIAFMNSGKFEIDKNVICKIHKLFSEFTNINSMAGKAFPDMFDEGNENTCKSKAPIQKALDYVNQTNSPLFAKAYHIQHKIHEEQPFRDHNKRTGRYTMNLILAQEGYTPVVFNQTGDDVLYHEFLFNQDTGLLMLYELMLRTQGQIIDHLNASFNRKPTP